MYSNILQICITARECYIKTQYFQEKKNNIIKFKITVLATVVIQ